MENIVLIDTLVTIIDRLTRQPGILSLGSVEALERIGDILMDNLGPIRDAIQRQADTLAETLTTEIGQITEKLGAVVSVGEVQNLAEEIDQKTAMLAGQIRNIVPDTEMPAREPAPPGA